MKLFNVIHNTPLVNHEKLEYVEYVQLDVKDKDLSSKYLSFINSKTTPILIVGYSLAKKLHGNIDVLNHEITSNSLYWTFSYEEHRSKHIETVFDFLHRRILNIRFSREEYCLIDPVFSNIRNEDEIRKYLSSLSLIYMYKEMIYAYSSDSYKIYGIDLKTYQFFGFDSKKMIDIISPDCKLIDDPEGDIYVEYKVKFPFVHILKRYIPLLIYNEI